MSTIDLGTAAIHCPKCGSTQLTKGDTPDTQDEGTCISCEERFSLDAEVRKIGDAFQEAVADALL